METKELEPVSEEVPDSKLIQKYIAYVAKEGWQVDHTTDSAVQIRKPKEWNKTAVLLSSFAILLFGVGFLFLLLCGLDYAIKKDRVVYVTADQLRVRDLPELKEKANVALIGIVVLLFAALACTAVYVSF